MYKETIAAEYESKQLNTNVRMRENLDHRRQIIYGQIKLSINEYDINPTKDEYRLVQEYSNPCHEEIG